MSDILHHYTVVSSFSFFFFNDTATTEIYTLSLHDALPIYRGSGAPARPGDAPHTGRRLQRRHRCDVGRRDRRAVASVRSEEHTSELQSQSNLVCRLLLEKKKITTIFSIDAIVCC